MRIRRIFQVILFVLIGLVPGSVEAQGTSLAVTGPYTVGRFDGVTVNRRDGSTFDATVYFPAQPAQAGQAADGAMVVVNKPLPVLAFGHGYMQHVDTYASMLRELASWGYIVIAPLSFEADPFPNHSVMADDLSASLTFMQAQNAVAGSPFYRRVDGARMGALGHSMGAGASLLAASRDPRIVAVSALAAAETTPSAIAVMPEITRPVQFVGGSMDAMVPAANHQTPLFEAGNEPKESLLIEGGFHCGFQDYTDFGLLCDTGTLSRADQQRLVRGYVLGWFREWVG